MIDGELLSLQECARKEPLPLVLIQDAILQFLRGREDCVLFGAHAVNAYLNEQRTTPDVDLISTRAAELAQELSDLLMQRFNIACVVQVWRGGKGNTLRIFEVRKPEYRLMVDIRPVDTLPPSRKIMNMQVVLPEKLIAAKVYSYHCRTQEGDPRSFTDQRDLAELLLHFPKFVLEVGAVRQCLIALSTDVDVLSTWESFVRENHSQA